MVVHVALAAVFAACCCLKAECIYTGVRHLLNPIISRHMGYTQIGSQLSGEYHVGLQACSRSEISYTILRDLDHSWESRTYPKLGSFDPEIQPCVQKS